MSESTDVVIVGAGAAGCAAAYYLTQAGASVTVVEREGVATQSSGWSAGGINPIHGVAPPLRPLAMESYRLHLSLWPELKRATGMEFEARIISAAQVAESDAEIPPLRELRDEFEAADGFSGRVLDRAELRAWEPRLADHVVGGLLMYGNGVVDGYLYTSLLAMAAQDRGMTVVPGAVRGLETAGERVTGVMLEDQVIPCGAVILAMGPWTGEAERWLGMSIPVEPLKGEILRLRPAGAALANDVTSSKVSIFNRAGGQIWVGATQERRGFDKEPSQSARDHLWAEATRLMPEIADAKLIQQTACLRPLSSDGLPILGRAPAWQNAYLSTGAGKKGILLSTGMGKALADLITTGTTALSIEVTRPDRFVGVSA